ncbi:MAG: hypothetical protein AAB927_04080 [Patescibacteria group bacterium]
MANPPSSDSLFGLEFSLSQRLKGAAKRHEASNKLQLKNAVKITQHAAPLCEGYELSKTEMEHAEALVWEIASTNTNPLSPLAWNPLVLFVRTCKKV